jgi:TPR repeat protein
LARAEPSTGCGFGIAVSTKDEQGRGGLEKNDERAVFWYRESAHLDGLSGILSLARMYKEGRAGMPVNSDQVQKLCKRAALIANGGSLPSPC